MYFASQFVYDNEEDEYEYVSDDEFQGGMDLSDSSSDNDSEDARRPRNQKAPQSKHHWQREQKEQVTKPTDEKSSKRWFRKADTNVVSIGFDTLVSACNTHAGDPVVCPMCQAILSHISKLITQNDNTVWKCEFCGHSMNVDIAPEERPTSDEVTYLLEPGITATSTNELGRDESLVIFCVDTSGSMCVTTEVEGKVKLRNKSQLRRMHSFSLDGDPQYLPLQTCHDVTYVSRLEAMQTAVEHQLVEMAQGFPHRRVALIAFNNSVRIIGDGLQEEITVTGDKLMDVRKLTDIGCQMPIPQPINQSHGRLCKKVNELEEGGSTALGPALIIAINMAASSPGSKVIVCTDGKANIGLGNLEEEVEEIENTFYSSIGDTAVSKCVTVSVTTIQGTDCKLVHLGQLADKTGGQVNIVDPLHLVKEFGNILNEDFIATKVKSKFMVHKALYVIDEKDENNKACCAEFEPGNVKRDTVFTFAFGRRSSKAKELKSEQKLEGKTGSDSQSDTASSTAGSVELEGAKASSPEASKSEIAQSSAASDSPSEFPFQVQIEYTDRQGARGLRVVTRSLPATDKRQEAELNVNLEILGAHAAKQSADLALKGEYTQSRGTSLMNQRLAWRSSHSTTGSAAQRSTYRNVYHQLKSMENHLNQVQSSERMTRGLTYSDEEDSVDGMDDNSGGQGTKTKKKKKKVVERIREMTDTFANMVYYLRRPSNQTLARDTKSEDIPSTHRSSAVVGRSQTNRSNMAGQDTQYDEIYSFFPGQDQNRATPHVGDVDIRTPLALLSPFLEESICDSEERVYDNHSSAQADNSEQQHKTDTAPNQ